MEGFDFFQLDSDADGTLQSPAVFSELKQHLVDAKITDLVFIAHGFRNDAADASNLYSMFLHSFRGDLALPEFKDSLANRTIAVAGVFWPSKKFSEGSGGGDATDSGSAGDESGSGGAQSIDGAHTIDVAGDRARVMQQLQELKELAPDAEQVKRIDAAIALLPSVEDAPEAVNAFVAHILAILPDGNDDPMEGLAQIRATTGVELVRKLSTPIFLPTVKREADSGGAMSMSHGAGHVGAGGVLSIGSAFKSVTGKIGQFLNLTTWYIMKNMAGTVGTNMLAACLGELRASDDVKTVRIHLVGHSLGGRLMTAAAKACTSTPGVTVNSLTLLEAAFSHYGFSAGADSESTRGFFREVLETPVVTGPIVSTFSYQDTVVGKAYAISSRLAGDSTKAIGDANDKFGGIGRNGAQRTTESTSNILHKSGVPYEKFALRVVNCLDGSNGLIKDHSDITNADVSYLFASAMADT